MATQTGNALEISGPVPVRGTRWAEKYLAIPYAEGGLGFDGCDCWGLYSLIMATEIGAAFPGIDAISRERPHGIRHAIDVQILSGRWIVDWRRGCDGIDPPRRAGAFSIAVMTGHIDRAGRAPLHVGCCLGDGRLIHTTREQGAHIIDICDPRTRHRILAIGRPA